ncbi:iron-containing redox enzyme family protein [Cysteiniphilum litorale]|uniref:iron-containing redox enzyme family protein n=1 Tax=Cysteiniphilum litorale TaxID=2056700 RepID=UPI003F88276F
MIEIDKEKLIEAVSSPIYANINTWEITNNPWLRPLRPSSFKYLNYETISSENYLNYSSMALNRALTAFYEKDFVFLADNIFDSPIKKNSFELFYDKAQKRLESQCIDQLETLCLSFLHHEIVVSGKWTKASFNEYFNERVLPMVTTYPESFNLVKNSMYKKDALHMLLIQHSLDFLVEASHMGRTVLGDYGQIQSELFKIMIDEFGYGVHDKKHNTLFKNLLKNVGLLDQSHSYWQFYLTSTLLVNNYFHYITKSPSTIFEYFGAITYAENAFSPYCKNMADLINTVLGKEVMPLYYTEHAHIDIHHGKMAYQNILMHAIDLYGEGVIEHMVRGIESTIYLQSLAENDLCAQLDWMSKKLNYQQLGMIIKDRVLQDENNLTVSHLIEPKGELSVTHVHDGDELCVVNKGCLRFISGPQNSHIDLHEGDAVVIRKNRLHGAVVLSDVCHYNIYSIKDYKKYASNNI